MSAAQLGTVETQVPAGFPAALREAVLSGRARRIDRTHFGPAEQPSGGGRFERPEREAAERRG